MKVHLAKKFSNGKVNIEQTECGKRVSRYSAVRNGLMIAKTSLFNRSYVDRKESVCVCCLAKAKEQNRLLIETL
jgi:hypothetical protein